MPDSADLAVASARDAAPLGDDLVTLRAEIDRLDDALHDLLMHRAEVVARLAASRSKGNGVALRPGREAAILRRLLARHQGPLPPAALVRLWRELLAATTAMQAPMTVAAWLPDAGVEVLRAHLGLSSPVTRWPDEAAALAESAAGRAALVALPAGGRWWRTHRPDRLFVTARLPFFGPANGSDATVFLLSPAAPDPSGEDRTLLRIPTGAEPGLVAAGLPHAALLREDGLTLTELPGMVAAADARLAALGATVLGAYAAPVAA